MDGSSRFLNTVLKAWFDAFTEISLLPSASEGFFCLFCCSVWRNWAGKVQLVRCTALQTLTEHQKKIAKHHQIIKPTTRQPHYSLRSKFINHFTFLENRLHWCPSNGQTPMPDLWNKKSGRCLQRSTGQLLHEECSRLHTSQVLRASQGREKFRMSLQFF